MLFQVFHNLKNSTDSNAFKCIKEGSIVKFNFKADPNYGHLSGTRGDETCNMLCTMKHEWRLDWGCSDYKYNFLPVTKNENGVWSYKKSNIEVIIPIANDKTGELHTCEIHDNGYIILEVRDKNNQHYYHNTNNSEVDIKFEPTEEKILTEEDCSRIRNEWGKSRGVYEPEIYGDDFKYNYAGVIDYMVSKSTQ